MYDWYFTKNENQDDLKCDEFVDSKFTIDKSASFSREIIQNSLDAHLENNDPVEVEFELNRKLKRSDIPGAEYIYSTVKHCIENTQNTSTLKQYENALKVLEQEYVYCLKVSDYNTTGVKSGRDNAWGALVYDTGKSVKKRATSAGSFGVGKKAPYIISSCRTVFYSTKNETDELFQGKAVLIDFYDDDGIRRNHKGWYGLLDQQADARERIKPVDSNFNEINDFFHRHNKTGTDVIIVGTNLYGEEEKFGEKIIFAVLENFFVAITERKLIVRIKGFFDEDIEISDANFHKIISKYYLENTPHKETSTLINGNLANYYHAYLNGEIIYLPINDDGIELGNVVLHIVNTNSKNKKYYSIVRSHGMKICDIQLGTDQPYSAVAYIDGEKLNEILLKLENAAHDDFTLDKEYADEKDIKICKKMFSTIKDVIIEYTKISVEKEQQIEGLEDLLSFNGKAASLKEKTIVIKEKKGGRGNEPHKPKSTVPPSPPEPPVDPPQQHKPKHPKTPKYKRTEILDFAQDPFTISRGDGEYSIFFKLKKDIKNASTLIYCYDSENTEDYSVANIIESIKLNGKSKKFVAGLSTGWKIDKDELIEMKVKLSINQLYRIAVKVYDDKAEIKDE